jgi:hypothetical protein
VPSFIRARSSRAAPGEGFTTIPSSRGSFFTLNFFYVDPTGAWRGLRVHSIVPYRGPDADRLLEAERERRAAEKAERRRRTAEKGRRTGQTALVALAGAAGALHVALVVGWGSTFCPSAAILVRAIALLVLGAGGLAGILAGVLGATALLFRGPTLRCLGAAAFGLIVSGVCFVGVAGSDTVEGQSCAPASQDGSDYGS